MQSIFSTKKSKAENNFFGDFDRKRYKPVIKCSICTGERVAGFKNLATGKFEEVMLVRNEKELDLFKKQYGIRDEIGKEY
ncbi:MAG: aspartate dehydrogenase [Lachnospiraceae bacterium]|nr:aspartate dehydrogenase [Lachnospiraceae bacterium]